jgi:hypothetical protein
VLTRLKGAVARRGLQVPDALRTADGRYWSYVCGNVDCCPPEGVEFDPAASPAAVAATVAGRIVLPDRAAFEAQLAPIGGLSRRSIIEAGRRAADRLLDLVADAADEPAAEQIMLTAGRAGIDEAIARYADGGRLDDDEVAWLSVLLVSTPVRDIAYERALEGPEVVATHWRLWLDLMRRVEADLLPAPGTLFAIAAWRKGEGPLARLAIERVLDEDPFYHLAELIHHALSAGLAPSVLTEPIESVRPARARRPRRRSSSRRARSREA